MGNSTMIRKKSFALLVTILFLISFSFLSLYILEIKTFQSDTQTKQYQKTQAQFHISLIKGFITNLDLNQNDEPCINTINIENDQFYITANLSYISSKQACTHSSNPMFDTTYTNGVAIIDIYVESRSSMFHIKLHERFLKKL